MSNPEICGGALTFDGTRISFADVVKRMLRGTTESELLAEFVCLSPSDLVPVAKFVAEIRRSV